jgi:hypothetical protein
MRKIAIIMAMALVLCGAVALSAQAFVLDFNVTSPSNGTGTYAGGANPFIGANIKVLNIVGIDTPLNQGVSVPIFNGVLAFTTGNFVKIDGTEYDFGAGGSITVNGAIPTVTGNVTSHLLMSGSFIPNAAGEVPELEPGTPGPLFSADFTDTKYNPLLAYFGIPDNPTLFGSINLRFNGALNPDGFSLTSLSGDVTNVPVPPSALLFGSGLLGLVGFRFRRHLA